MHAATIFVTVVPSILVTVGAATIAIIFNRLFNLVILYFKPCKLSRYLHSIPATAQKTRPFALVTGATDGIGYGYCHELAKRGFNLVIHGRNAVKLADVAAKIQRQFPEVVVRTWEFNARKISSTAMGNTSLMATIEGLSGPLTVLVNNLGVGYDAQTADEINDIIAVNLLFPVQLTNFLKPTLLANTPALILTMGSDADVGMPYLNIYSGAKGFLHSWSKSLASELADQKKDIEIMYLRTGNVRSQGNRTELNAVTADAMEFAGFCLDRVGCEKRVVSAWWRHAVSRLAIEILPQHMFDKMLGDVVRKNKETMTMDYHGIS